LVSSHPDGVRRTSHGAPSINSCDKLSCSFRNKPFLTTLVTVMSRVGWPRAAVAAAFGLADELFLSWFRSLNAARNICAHHARCWNRELGYATLLPQKNKFPAWHGESTEEYSYWHNFNDLSPSAGSDYPYKPMDQRVETLFAEYPDIPLQDPPQPVRHALRI
jgi:Abi-like protein